MVVEIFDEKRDARHCAMFRRDGSCESCDATIVAQRVREGA
jgi:hypothetical protein